MKKVLAILTNDNDFDFDLFCKETTKSVYLGAWGKIEYNKTECIKSITKAINHFLKESDKKQIVFVCHCDDINDIKLELAEHDINTAFSVTLN